MKVFFIFFSTLLLVYILWPGPDKISDFNPLPDSAKSTLSGDTVQIPNVSAYFSNHYRKSVIPFYFENYWKNYNLPFPPLRINHPPQYSWEFVKKHTDSTYLEEFVYPLRNSLFVNGLEMFNPDGSRIFTGAPLLEEEGKFWLTKTNLRLYTANIWVRIIVWLGIVVSIAQLFKLTRKIFKE